MMDLWPKKERKKVNKTERQKERKKERQKERKKIIRNIAVKKRKN